MKWPKVLLVGLCILCCATAAHGAIPHADDPDAYTEKQYRQDLLAYNKKTMSQAYLKVGQHDPKWDDLVVELLDEQAAMFTNYQANNKAQVPVTTSQDRRNEIAKQLKELNCSDPMAGYVLLLHSDSDSEEYLDYARWVYRSLLKSDYPVNRKTAIAWRLARLLNEKDLEEEASRVVQSWIDLTCQAAADPDMSLDDQYFLYRVFEDNIDDQWLPRWKAVCERIDIAEPQNPWLTGMICGAYHVEAGWEVRGTGFAHTVTDDGWKGFAEHLAIARRHLVKAWKVAPQFPVVPDELITVSMGQSSGEERLWFERAVQAQFDYYPAYTSYLWSIRPRWGGSSDQMYDFAVECLETDRFDTKVPALFYKAMKDIAKDREDYQHFSRPGVYEQFITYFQGRKNEPNASDSAQWWDSMKAAMAWRAGRYHDSIYWMKRLGDGFIPRTFSKFEGDRVLAPSECYARTGEFEPEMNRARQHWAAEEYRKASETFEEALVHLAPDDPARAYFRHLSIWAQRQHQDAKGLWVDLLNQPDLWGWIVRRGQWSADEQGRITGVSVKRGLYLESRFNLGYRMEVKGTISFPDEEYKKNYNAGVLLASRLINSKRYHRDVLLYREKQSVMAARNFAYGQTVYPAIVQDSNTFLIQMWDEHVRFVLNDQVIFEDRVMPRDLPSKLYPFAIGGWYTAEGVTIRYDELKARRLTQRPAWVADPDQHDEKPPATN